MKMFLIQLLGFKTLLNSQLGGFYHDYLPRADDEEAFKSLETDYFRICLINAYDFLNEHASGIADLFRAFQKEAVAIVHPITNRMREAIGRQATP